MTHRVAVASEIFPRRFNDQFHVLGKIVHGQPLSSVVILYGFYSYPQLHVVIENAAKVPQLAAFDAFSVDGESRLSEMKRSFALKLSAGGEEAPELFASLARDLATIITR
jgi:hypothetical protein